jgi:cytochrome P450
VIATSRPRGPRGHFLSGHLPELSRDWLGGLTRYAREYGDYVPLRLGPKRAVLLSHPDYVEYVLVTNARNFIKSPALRNSRRLLGNGLVTSEGDFWRRQRRLAQPAFHRGRIASYGEVMVAYTERLLAAWPDGAERDFHADMMQLTLEIVAKTLFDADVRGAAADVGAALAVILERFNARLNSLLFLVPDTLPLPGNQGLLRAAQRLDVLIYDIIARRRASGQDTGDLLSMLLQAQDEDGSQMTDRQLRDEVMTLFLAGHETTAIALSWAQYLLAQHPAVEEQVVAELRAVLGGRAPTVADLPRLRYTEMVVTEALRLYPPAWTVAREALGPCEIGGHEVSRGTILMMSQWVLHRDPRYFEAPEAFRPERWANGLAKELPKYVYFPFGGGPRVCIGSGFAMMEAVLLLATITQQFHVALVPGRPVVPWPSATLRPRDGVPVVVHRR